MRRLASTGAGVLAASLLWLPTASASEDAPLPEGYEAPRSTVQVFQAWEAPRSTVSTFYTDPDQVDTAELEEALGAEDDGEDTVVQLADRFLFDFGSAELRPTGASSLDTLVALLSESETAIEVTGHTDSMGTDQINQPLSEERAAAVAGYLAEQGIDADRITTEGRGSSEPVAENTHPDGRDNPEGRQQNRRVEVRYTNE